MRIDSHSIALPSQRLLGAWRRLRLDERIAVVALALAALLRIALIGLGWPHLNSDEAVVGLMARHIVGEGARPLFIWGVHYEGPFEAYIAAPFFAIFGSSTLLLHLSNQILIVAFLIVMYALTRAIFDPFVAVLSTIWLGFGSSFALRRELVTVGGYQEVLLLSALLLLLAWSRLRRSETLPRDRRAWIRCMATYVGIGCCVGLGLWSSLLIAPLVALTLLAFGVCRRRELARGGAIALVLAAILSALPYLSYQITREFPAFTEARRISHPDFVGSALASQTLATFTVGLPTLLGSPVVCAGPRGGGSALCGGGNLLYSLVILSIFAIVAWRCLLSVWAVLRSGAQTTLKAVRDLGEERSEAVAARQARWWIRVILLGVVATSLAGYLPSPDAVEHPVTAARYLLPILLATPLVIEFLAREAAPALRGMLDSRFSVQMRDKASADERSGVLLRRVRSRLAVAAVALVLALTLANTGATLAEAISPNGGGLPPSGDQKLMAFLRTRSISAFYADYWTCYRLAFESDEQIRCAVRGQNGDVGLELINNHYRPYIATVARQKHPAYILPAGTATDINFTHEAATEHLPYRDYRRVVVAGYAVYYYPYSG